MAKLPFMKIFVPDLISDTYTLSDGEFGAYTRIMFALWRFRGELPLDHKQLAKIAGSTGKTWPGRWASISRYFVISEGKVSHTRITEDLRAASSTGNGTSHQGFPGESSLSAKPLESLDPASLRARSREPQLKPEPELEAATPSATQPLRGLDDWPDVPPGRMLDLFVVGVGSPWLDPSKNISPRFHAQAPGYLQRWRAEGCSWLATVLPVAVAISRDKGEPINSLKAFDAAIIDAHRAATSPHQSQPGNRYDDKLAGKNDNLATLYAAGLRLAERERDAGDGSFRYD